MHKNNKKKGRHNGIPFFMSDTNYFVLGAVALGAGVTLASALAGVALEQPVEQEPEEQHDCLPERIL